MTSLRARFFSPADSLFSILYESACDPRAYSFDSRETTKFSAREYTGRHGFLEPDSRIERH
jgi:hypothetical protein